MTAPEWSVPATHTRHDLQDATAASFDRALHVKRYEWVRDTMCSSKSAVLDMGCGTGFGVGVLASVAREACGVDFSDAGLIVARRHHAAANTRFTQADLTSADLIDTFRGQRFDVITSMETIEHLEDYVTFIDNAARLLQPDGVFIVGTPNRRMTYERFPGRRHMDASHVQEFTRRSLEHTLRECFAEIAVHFEWIPGYWAARAKEVAAAVPSRRAVFARRWLPPRVASALHGARVRFGRTPSVEPTQWSVDDVEIVPAVFHPELESEAFCLIAVCRQPRCPRERSA